MPLLQHSAVPQRLVLVLLFHTIPYLEAPTLAFTLQDVQALMRCGCIWCTSHGQHHIFNMVFRSAGQLITKLNFHISAVSIAEQAREQKHCRWLKRSSADAGIEAHLQNARGKHWGKHWGCS